MNVVHFLIWYQSTSKRHEYIIQPTIHVLTSYYISLQIIICNVLQTLVPDDTRIRNQTLKIKFEHLEVSEKMRIRNLGDFEHLNYSELLIFWGEGGGVFLHNSLLRLSAKNWRKHPMIDRSRE